MACAFFRRVRFFTQYYLGFCTAVSRPYVPSIAEMEEHCFKVNGQCQTLRNNPYFAHPGSDIPGRGSVDPRASYAKRFRHIPSEAVNRKNIREEQ